MFWIRLLISIFYFLFRAMDFVIGIRYVWWTTVRREGLRSVWNAETPRLTRISRLKRSDLYDELLEWNKRPNSHEAGASCNFLSRKERNQKLILYSFMEAMGQSMAQVILNDPDPMHTAKECSKAVKIILARAKESVRFAEVFKKVIEYLEILDRSSHASVMDFLTARAQIVLERKTFDVFDFVFTHCSPSSSPTVLFEWSMAAHSLFIAMEAGYEHYFGDGGWRKPRRTVHAALSLIGFAGMDKCSPSLSSRLIVTKHRGVEGILLLKPDFEFKRFYSTLGKYHEEVHKELMMWDITYNRCNEVVESRWSVQMFERAMWTLEFGRKHIDIDMYNELKKCHGKRNLDFTHMDALLLMTFSISGMVRFCGMNDGAYRLTASHEDAVEVYGRLPMPRIQDLLTLHIVKAVGRNRYRAEPLPGVKKTFKAVRVGNRVKLVENRRPEVFSAELMEQVE